MKIDVSDITEEDLKKHNNIYWYSFLYLYRGFREEHKNHSCYDERKKLYDPAILLDLIGSLCQNPANNYMCTASRESLMERAGIQSTKTYKNTIDLLKEEGWIVIKRRGLGLTNAIDIGPRAIQYFTQEVRAKKMKEMLEKHTK